MGMVVNPSRFGGGGGGGGGSDTYWSSVVALWPFDESAGATSWTDVKNGHTLTRTGSPISSSSQAKFGTTSLYNPGTATQETNKLTSDSSTDFSLSGDFTIDLWAYPVSQVDSNMGMLSRVGQDTSNGGFQLLRASTNEWYVVIRDTTYKSINGGTSTLGVWTHIAVDRSGSTVRLYVNGTPAGTTITSSITLIGGQLELCLANNATDNQDWTGYLQDVRITKGVARYAGSSFSPPTGFYPHS